MGDKHVQDTLGDLPTIYDWNCAHVEAPYNLIMDGSLQGGEAEYFSGHALLRFMIAATPDARLAEAMSESPSGYLEKMSFGIEHNIVGDNALPAFTIDNVPGAVSPVKAKMAYIQVPDKDIVRLGAVWRVRTVIILFPVFVLSIS